MKITMGQPPSSCACHLARGVTVSCTTQGCSKGSNRFCKDGGFDALTSGVLGIVVYGDGVNKRSGCTCPVHRSPTHSRDHSHGHSRHRGPNNRPVTYNGYVGSNGYYYDTCTSYGGNARDINGNVLADADRATECCNYCCGRHDPHPLPPTPNHGHKMMLNELLYLNSLIILASIILRTN